MLTKNEGMEESYTIRSWKQVIVQEALPKGVRPHMLQSRGVPYLRSKVPTSISFSLLFMQRTKESLESDFAFASIPLNCKR